MITTTEVTTCDVCGEVKDDEGEWYSVRRDEGYQQNFDVCGYDMSLAEPYQAFYLGRLDRQSPRQVSQIIMDLKLKKADDLKRQIEDLRGKGKAIEAQ